MILPSRRVSPTLESLTLSVMKEWPVFASARVVEAVFLVSKLSKQVELRSMT